MKWTDRTAGSPHEDLNSQKYPEGYWALALEDSRYEYYLDKTPQGWRLNPEDGTEILYFDDLDAAKATVAALARMGAIKIET